VRAAIVIVAVIAGVALLPGSAASGQQRPYVLTALADIGTVYWRYDCVHYRQPEWSLGIHIFQNAASAGATFRAGKLTVRRPTIQPGEPTIWFPFRKERVQRMTAAAGGEAETVYARVKVTFGEAHSLANCWSYAPPRVDASLYGRDHHA
jgi:hypothetical protein